MGWSSRLGPWSTDPGPYFVYVLGGLGSQTPKLLKTLIYLNLNWELQKDGRVQIKTNPSIGIFWVLFRTVHYKQFFIVFAVVIDAGSRYEVDYPSGLSHLLEKLAFQVPYPIIMQFCQFL